MWCVWLNNICQWNVSYGPWQSGAYFRQMQATAENLGAELTPGDPLLNYLWDAILMGGGSASAHLNRQKFIEELVCQKSFNVKGPKASPSRWFSWHVAFNTWDRCHHTRLLGLCSLGIKCGWFSHYSEVWTLAESASIDVAEPSAKSCRHDAECLGEEISETLPVRAGSASSCVPVGEPLG